MSSSLHSRATQVARVKILGSQTIQRIEDELREVESRRLQRLLLPQDPKDRRLGGEAALIQLLITWGRQQPEAILETYLTAGESDTEERMQKLAERPFGFIGLCMARDVTDQSGGSLTRLASACIEKELGNYWQPRERATDTRQLDLFRDHDDSGHSGHSIPKRGRQLFVPVVDHHHLGDNPNLCVSSGKPRERSDFVGLADREILKRLTNNETRQTPIEVELTNNIGAIVFELFDNTHRWAQQDVFNAKLHRSVRGLLSILHEGPREQLEQLVEGMPALQEYLRHTQIGKQKLRLLEISLFDSGPGLAARWLGPERWRENLTCSEELAACRECLELHKTSSLEDGRGVGLHVVVTTLSALSGFLRIRTGKLSLCRDFVQTPFDDKEDRTGHVLFDWTTRSEQLQPMPRVEGNLYTMLIPIG